MLQNKIHFDPKIHHRSSIRLKGYNYAEAGVYFITICTHDKKCLFGEILNEKVYLNNIGKIAQSCWHDIPKHFPSTELSEFVIMPNHIHGIIFLNHSHPYGASKTIGSIVRGFKIGVTKWVRHNTDLIDIWQRNYYEHIIRDEVDYYRIAEYITDNPKQWKEDILHSN